MTLSIDLPESVLAALRQSPDEAERDVRLAAAIEWFRRGALSQGRAAEVAGLSRAELIDELAARKIDVFEVDLEEVGRADLEEASPGGAEAMRGFARRLREEPKRTADWMRELRESELSGEG